MSRCCRILTHLALAGLAVTAKAELPPTELSSGVVAIRAHDGSEIRKGAGFIVALDSKTAHLVTAARLVAGSRSLEVTFPTRRAPLPGQVARMQGDEPSGIAVILVQGEIPIGVRRLPMSPRAPDSATPIWVVPPGSASRSGRTVAVDLTDWRKPEVLFQETERVELSSGLPLVQAGFVVGLIQRVDGRHGFLTFSPEIQSALDEWGVSARIQLQDLGQELRLAANRGDALRVGLLLEESQGVVDARDAEGQTALHLAVQRGYEEVVERLLSKSADVDAASDSGETALHLAVQRRSEALVQRLLAAGADLNSQTNSGVSNRSGESPLGDTPLHLAIRHRHADLAQLLIDQGADLELKSAVNRTPLGSTALDLALEIGMYEIARRLLAAGADPNSENGYGLTPLSALASQPDLSMAKLLIARGAEVDSALQSAIVYNHLTLAQLLLDHGAKMDSKNWQGSTPVHTAVSFGRREILQLMVDRGADLSVRDGYGKTPLDWARTDNERGVLEILEAATATEAPLHRAMAHNELALARFLLERGAATGSRVAGMETAMHLAVRRNSADFVELLLAFGAEIEARNALDETSLYLAADIGQKQTAMLLIDHGADIDSKNGFGRNIPLIALTRVWNLDSDRQQIARRLLEKGADVNGQNALGITAIQRAAFWGQWQAIPFFLKHGADVNLQDDQGRTVLHIAAEKGHTETIRLLLAHGADVDVRDRHRKTSLDLARSAGHLDSARILEQAWISESSPTTVVGVPSEVRRSGSDEDLLEEMKAGVVKVTVDAEGARRVGTGFIIALDSTAAYVLTASHLLVGGDGFEVAFFPERFRAFPGRLLHLKEGEDRGFGVVLVEGEIPSGVRQLKLADDPAAIPGEALVLGFPRTREQQWVAAHHELISARAGGIAFARDGIAEGSSGGPVLQGQSVVGLVQTLVGSQAFATATPSIRAALKRWGLWHRIELEDPGQDLRAAARRGDSAGVEILIREYPSHVDSANSLGQSALHLAVVEGHVAALESLIAGRADVNVIDQGDESPLHYAVSFGRWREAEKLLAAGARVDAKNHLEETPLHFAIRRGHVELVQLLIDGGADPNLKDLQERTALFVAIEEGERDITRRLLLAGADPKSENLYDRRSPLERAILFPDLVMARLLIEHGADVDQKSEFRGPPLRPAIALKRPAAVRLLLERGADVHCRDCSGWRPLHAAVRGGSSEIVRLLIEHGAVVTARDGTGRTPLDWARASAEKEITAILESALKGSVSGHTARAIEDRTTF